MTQPYPPLIFTISKLFKKHYGLPRLSNKKNPLDELIFILLTLRTHETNYSSTYKNIRNRFYPWSKLINAKTTDISKSITSGGLGKQKAQRLKQTINIISNDCGKVSLNFLKKLDTKKCESYLTLLPGVGIKTARCILLYSLNRPVFPVDINTMRILKRLGIIDKTLDYKRDKAHNIIQSMIPHRLRYQLHVGLVVHGRKYCLPKNPKCKDCFVVNYCSSGKSQLGTKR